MFDKGTNRFFIKTVDLSGMPQRLRSFVYEEEIEKTKKDFGIICEIIDDMMMSRSIYADYVMSEMENLKQTEAVEGTVKQ